MATLDDATTETPEPSVPSEVSAFQKKSSSSLIAENQFPVSARNFPVLMRREFGRKRLTYISERRHPPGLEPKSAKIPCIFPEIREFGTRDRFAVASQHSHFKSLI